MDHKELVELDHQYMMQTYGRFDVDIDHGQGATLYDLAGKRYIDFSSGIGVNSIGYANPRWVEAITAQAGKLGHISNLFYSQPYAQLAKQLCGRSGMAAAFFGNSGAEANEGMIKLARKYSFDKYGKGRGTVITLKNSFHGRTITTLTATGQDVFHNYFFPFADGFRYAAAGDMDSLQEVAGHDVCAVMLELVQGEGGVLPMDPEYVHDLAVLCAERDWLLLVDEVQTGIGRTGTLFAFQQYGIIRALPGRAGPGHPRGHLRRQPHLRRRRPGGAGYPGRGRPGQSEGEGELHPHPYRAHGPVLPGGHPGPGPDDRGGGKGGGEQQGAGRPAHPQRPSGAHRRLRPAAAAPADHLHGGDRQGPGHYEGNPAVTQRET